MLIAEGVCRATRGVGARTLVPRDALLPRGVGLSRQLGKVLEANHPRSAEGELSGVLEVLMVSPVWSLRTWSALGGVVPPPLPTRSWILASASTWGTGMPGAVSARRYANLRRHSFIFVLTVRTR